MNTGNDFEAHASMEITRMDDDHNGTPRIHKILKLKWPVLHSFLAKLR